MNVPGKNSKKKMELVIESLIFITADVVHDFAY